MGPLSSQGHIRTHDPPPHIRPGPSCDRHCAGVAQVHGFKENETCFFPLLPESGLRMASTLAKAERDAVGLCEMRILQPTSGILKTGV